MTTGSIDALDAIEEAAIVGMAATFSVSACDEHSPVHDVLRDPGTSQFDHFPVRRRAATIGVLSREEASESPLDATVGEAMRPLDDKLLVAKTDALLLTLEDMADGPSFRLVLDRNEIRGIFTLSDMQKLTVRSLIFSRICHLEMLLGDFIRLKSGRDDICWLEKLNPKRRESVESKFATLKSEGGELDRLEAADFCDKTRAAVALGLRLGLSRLLIEEQMRDFERLRNQIAHSATEFARPRKARDTARLLRSLRLAILALRTEMAGIAR